MNLDRPIQSEKDQIYYHQRRNGAGYDLISIPSVPVFTLYSGALHLPDGKELCQMLEGSLVMVQSGGDWYSILDKSKVSKSVFAMGTDFYNLQVKSDKSIAPVLTIPVGR